MAALELNQIPRDAGDVYRYGEPLIESWMGTPNKGISLRQTQVNDPANYAGDFNNSAAGFLALRAIANTHSLAVNGSGVSVSDLGVAGALSAASLTVTPGATSLVTLSTSGLATLNSASVTTTLGVTGTSTLGVLNAAATAVTTLSSSGLATLNSASITTTLSITGTTTAAAINAGAISGTTGSFSSTLGVTGFTTLTAGSTSGNFTVGGLLTGSAGATISGGNTGVTTLSTSGLATLNSASVTTTLGVTGTSTLGAVNAGATSVTTLAASSTSTLTGAVTMVSSLTVGNATGVASGVIRLPNNQFVYSEETGGTDRQLLGLDSSNFVRVGDHVSGTASLSVGATTNVYLLGGGNIVLQVTSGPAIGFFAQTPNTRQTVSGSRAGNAALQSLCSALANYGLIIDTTT